MENDPQYIKLKEKDSLETVITDSEYCEVFGIPEIFEYTGEYEQIKSRYSLCEDGSKIYDVQNIPVTKKIPTIKNISLKKKTFILSHDHSTNLRYLYLKYNHVVSIFNISLIMGGDIRPALNRFDIIKICNKEEKEMNVIELLDNDFVIPMREITHHEVGIIIYYLSVSEDDMEVYEKIEQNDTKYDENMRISIPIKFKYSNGMNCARIRYGMIGMQNVMSNPSIALNKLTPPIEKLYSGRVKEYEDGRIEHIL